MFVLHLTRGVVLLTPFLLGQLLGDHGHAQRPATGPMLYIQERSIDMGRLREGEDGVAVFLIENRGTSDLVIKYAATSCGCTVVELSDDQKRIAPEQTLELTVLFQTKGKIGRQRNVVELAVNDPHEPLVKLVISADVETIFRIEPYPLVHLRSARRGMPLPPLEIYPTFGAKKLDALEVDIPAGLLDFDREPIENEDGIAGVRLTFRVPDEMELGMVNGAFKLRGTVEGKTAELTVTVTGEVVGALTVQPSLIQSLAATPRGRRFAPLVVAATNNLPFEILDVQAGPYLDSTFESRRAGKEWAIRTTLRDDVPDGPIASTIRIRTNNDGQPLLEVPVFVRVRQRYMIEPRMVLLGGKNGKKRMRVRIQRGDPSALVLSKVESNHPAIAAMIDDKASQLRHVAFVTVGIARGAAPDGPIDAEIIVKTNIDGAEEIHIPVHYTP